MDSVPEQLLDILDNLDQNELERFQWFLYNGVKGFTQHITVSQVKKVERENTVDMMVAAYREVDAVKITLEILRKMNRNDLKEQLTAKFKKVLSTVGDDRDTAKQDACVLTLDPNTAARNLYLFEGNRKVIQGGFHQLFPDHPERFDWWGQVLCKEGLTGRSYWEVEWSIWAVIAVTYKGINRKGKGEDSQFGHNEKSWRLTCQSKSYTACHNWAEIVIRDTPSSNRVGVYLDWLAGTLSFYSVSSDTLSHLHTFHSTFTEPLYPGFGIWRNGFVSLCQ